MSDFLRRISVGTAVIGTSFLLVCAACYVAGIRINTTKSVRVGLYLTSNTPIEKGSYVSFCPPHSDVFDEARNRGYIGAGLCPGGYGYMMKKILAAKKDVVNIDDDGVHVNGELLPFSAPLKADKGGRPLPHYQSNNLILGNSEVLLMSDVSATSFDGRYFGPMDISQIKTVVTPLLTF